MGSPVFHVDTYLSHPSRDFAQTDEALRLRRDGESNVLTYKGPKLDQVTKTRMELELRLPKGEEFASQLRDVLEALGFHAVIDVRKQRRSTTVRWQDATIEVSFDELESLGLFVELETSAVLAELPVARRQIAALAEELGLTRNERRSYCELMLRQAKRA
jgi:adenylate cyclase class 2